MTVSEPSQLCLDLLQTIHFELASNVDKKLAGRHHRIIPTNLVRAKNENLKFFRGYVRFRPSSNGMRKEPDPRHLCGDTSESDISESDSDSDSSPSYCGAEKTPSSPRKKQEEKADSEAEVEKSFVDDDDLLRTGCAK